MALLPAGIVPFTLATEVEGDFATATLEMPDGTTAERTYDTSSVKWCAIISTFTASLRLHPPVAETPVRAQPVRRAVRKHRIGFTADSLVELRL